MLQFSQLLHAVAVALLAVALASVEAGLASMAVNSLGAGWAHGMAATGMAATGTGTATLIMFTITSSSLVALAFPGGGVGAGAGAARGGVGAATRTGTTVTVTPMAIPMVMATVAHLTAPMATAMDMGPSTNTDSTEIAASPEFLNYSAGCNALVITMDPLTESWGRRREAQSERTKKTTET